jgi:TonB family protein
VDTLYRTDGTVMVGKFKKGKLKSRILDTRREVCPMPLKPEYPHISLKHRQEEFLGELEVQWQMRNLQLTTAAGLIHPKFNGGTVDDFALWVNSQVVYPRSFVRSETSRTVLVEFTVTEEGSLSDVHAVFGSNAELNAAAVAAVSKSPKWEPAEFQGEKRSVRLTVPVVFANE